MFKKGDLVIVNGTKYKGYIGIVEYTDEGFYGIGHPRSIFSEHFLTLLPLDNPLNKKLYPNRVERGGFLVPRDFADKLNEENK